MKRISHVFAVILIAIICFRCHKELSKENSLIDQRNNEVSPITPTLQGNVFDEHDQPAAGVIISAGFKTAITNSGGYFRIDEARLDKNSSFVTAEKPGYFKAFRSFRATSGVNRVVIKLITKTFTGSINATTGGEVTLPNGAKVLIPANAVVKVAGGAYTGNINVYAAFIDPTAIGIVKIVPGSFMADDKDGNRVVLSSYGMLAVELESTGGERLQISPVSQATLTMPVPSPLLSSAPANISLWYIDEKTGIWKEEGMAKKKGNNYVGEVKHLSYWNCDILLPAISFSAIFKTFDNSSLTNVHVSVKPANNNTLGFAHGITDSLGQVSGMVPSNVNLVLEVLDECSNVVYSKNIGPFTQNKNLGTVIIPNVVPSLFTVKGRLLSCGNAPVTNGFAIIYWGNSVNYVSVDASGNFSMNIFTCLGTPQTCEIAGVDKTTQQQGTPLTISLAQKITDARDIQACGVSSEEFMNYTLDGTEFKLLHNDSLYVYDSAYGGNPTYLGGTISANNLLRFNVNGINAAGVYPLNLLNGRNYNQVTLIRPFDVAITAVPQRPGEFYAGHFSGSFTDSSSPALIHHISCTFRIKEY